MWLRCYMAMWLCGSVAMCLCGHVATTFIEGNPHRQVLKICQNRYQETFQQIAEEQGSRREMWGMWRGWAGKPARINEASGGMRARRARIKKMI